MLKKIYIEITNICNLKCNFCPDTNRDKKMMSVEDFETIIKKIHKHTSLVCLHVKGEPLLHNNLNEILNILEKYNLKCNITTNGTLLKDKLDKLKSSNAIRQLNISIHSITQNKELNKEYLKNIFESVDKLDNIIISYRLWNINNTLENNINKDIIKSIEEYYYLENINKKLIEDNYYKIKDNIFINQDQEFIWPNINNKEIIEKGRCLALKEQIAILVDGTVVPCCLDNNGDIPLGNIFEESLEKILNKKEVKKIKENFKNKVITCKLCKTCGFLKRLEKKRK